ncbi:uncharacterized protein LOC123716048 [Pieris brassicae]|uniref:uncharacterized protein LOC123716048 n=1 Tax=Pieris brassicae TaxID=7116 RepID=UPI001E65F3E3|nr:uncharacterized protein LOC123716048 [Pieris brassicae]
MGSNNSKSHDTAAASQKNETGKDIGGNPDPRSPTPEITRTPLQNKPGSKHHITKNMDLRKALENDKSERKLIHNNPILSAVIKNHLQSFDPRSPTQEFNRTPIVITSKTSEARVEQTFDVNYCGSPTLDNTTLDSSNIQISPACPELVPKNLYNEFYDLSLSDSLNNEEPLGSSTASNEVLENNISHGSPKLTQLLETNFDCNENGIIKISEMDETDGITKKNETLFSLLNPEISNVPIFKLLNDDPRSPSFGIDRTPIVVSKHEEPCIEENVEEMSNELLIKVLENSNSEIKHIINAENNSEGIPIYEDIGNNSNDTPKKSKSASNDGSRTPLSCMKNKPEPSHGRSKSANTLFDPKAKKGLSQIRKHVSHIPRLKSLTKPNGLSLGSSISLKNSTMNGDCENTPPHSHRDKWDKESSIVL